MAQTGSNRFDGYQNYQRSPEFPAFPESQQFGGNMAVSLVTGTGTSSWTTVDLSSLVPDIAEYAQIRFSAEGSQFNSNSAYLDIRRDEQIDSATERILKIQPVGGMWEYEVSSSFKAPLTMGGIRSFQFQITGSVSSGIAWSLTLTGYHTRKRNVADANDISGSASGGSEGGGGGGPVITPVVR